MLVVIWVLALLAAAYAVLVAVAYLQQSKLLYLAGSGSGRAGATPGAIGLEYEEVRFCSPDGQSLHGWFVPAGELHPVVLFLHGNAGHIGDRLRSIRLLHALGLNVLIFDYRGYGLSSGTPTEEGTYQDALAAWNYLHERGFSPQRIIVHGRSLGAAIGAELARQHRPAALILESAFSSLPDIAAFHYWYVPARALVRFSYLTEEYVRDIRCPTLVIHSVEDELVPIAQGRRVFERIGAPKRFLLIRGSHNQGFRASGTRYTEGIRRFLDWAMLDCAPSTAREVS